MLSLRIKRRKRAPPHPPSQICSFPQKVCRKFETESTTESVGSGASTKMLLPGSGILNGSMAVHTNGLAEKPPVAFGN